jgi:hypothetical protein
MPTFDLVTTPAEQWIGLTNSYTQKLPHALKELIDNSLAASTAGDLDILINIAEQGDLYEITVSDSGPAITLETLPNALSIGKAKRTGLNEHGHGLKNVLAFCCPSNTGWSITTRPGLTYQVRAPWTSPMDYEVTGDHPFATGVTIRMLVTVEILRCYPGAKGRPNMDTLVNYLRHCMAVTYAFHPLMNHPTRRLTFKINGTLVRPEKPEAVRIAHSIRVTKALAPGAIPVSIELTHYRLDAPNADAKEYYKRNMSSSGLYLYLHNRLIKRIPSGELYGLEAVSHNDFNPFVCIVNVTGDPAGIPPTITTKNGLIETNPLTQGLMEYVREQVPVANARDPKIDGRDRSEAEMVREYINRVEPLFRDMPGFSIEENKTYQMDIGPTPPFDVVERRGTTLSIMEAKKRSLDMDAIGQMWRNVAFARRVPEFAGLTIKGVLVARTNETTALFRTLLDEYRAMDPNFICEVKTWADLGIGSVN